MPCRQYDLCVKGGYMCYSTCSMNPIENEAVVAEILRSANGSLKLVDKRPDMPGFEVRPGWNHWSVLSGKKSRTEEKKIRNKNSEKMQQRRKEWDEKKKELETKEDVVDVANSADTKEEELTSNVQDSNVDNRIKDVELHSDRFEPKEKDCWIEQSWNHNELLQRTQAAGLVHYKTFEDVPDLSKNRVKSSCFPPTDEEVQKFHLEKCVRCLPHGT